MHVIEVTGNSKVINKKANVNVFDEKGKTVSIYACENKK